MKEADVIITPIPQTDGKTKNRPAVVLREIPPYKDFLVCGVSTQLHQYVKHFDEIISPDDPDFAYSGLLRESVIRLGFLAILPCTHIAGSIGEISSKRHKRLLKALSDYLMRKE
ncbi:MAG: transcriptional regulator [Bacteroidetes bacterium]|nr:transcriptional regulator [Bacteroidota bacterium]